MEGDSLQFCQTENNLGGDRNMGSMPLAYGLMRDRPDVLEKIPALHFVKKYFPDYVKSVEESQLFARRFAREQILPRVLEVEKRAAADPTYVDWDYIREGMRRGFWTMFLPKGVGGAGKRAMDAYVMCEEMCAADVALTALLIFNFFGFATAACAFNPGVMLREMYAIKEAEKKGEPLFYAWAITEPSAGSDVEDPHALSKARMSIHARKVPKGYRVNGRKCFITMGSLARRIIFNAPTDPNRPLETSATFFVTSDREGFSVGRVEKKCGHKAKPTAELIFEDVFIPEKDCWMKEGTGIEHTLEILSVTRGLVGALGVGIGRGALERTIQYAYQQKVRGHRLIEEDWVQMAIADMLRLLDAARQDYAGVALAMDAIGLFGLFQRPAMRAALKTLPDRLAKRGAFQAVLSPRWIHELFRRLKGRAVPKEVVSYFLRIGSAAKVNGTDVGMEVASRCLDIVGLEGAAYRHGIEKTFRDVKASQIYEGTNQLNRKEVFKKELAQRFGISFI
jgi:alkylation response protein AidB-like acyl-CoA dehydrogenase